MLNLPTGVLRGSQNAQAHGGQARHVQGGGGQTDQQETQRHGVRGSVQQGASALSQGPHHRGRLDEVGRSVGA